MYDEYYMWGVHTSTALRPWAIQYVLDLVVDYKCTIHAESMSTAVLDVEAYM